MGGLKAKMLVICWSAMLAATFLIIPLNEMAPLWCGKGDGGGRWMRLGAGFAALPSWEPLMYD